MPNSCCNRAVDQTRQAVRQAYGNIARKGGSCCGPTPGCGSKQATKLAKGIGYSPADLAALPAGANLGLSCGNPTALAALRPGEVLLDLGSGAGFDIFIAARKVGPQGRAIGVDMTPDMVDKARRNIAKFVAKGGPANLEFRLGEIEHLPVADASVDVVISNCVINLSPDKPQVWREIARVLKPGGRVAVSDLGLYRELPAKVRQSVSALVGCVAGAVLITETEAMAKAAGLTQIAVATKDDYLDTMDKWHDPLYGSISKALPAGRKLSDYVTSMNVAARKARRRR